MSLNKNQKFLVHNVLFHYLELHKPDFNLRTSIEEIMQALQGEIVGDADDEVEIVDGDHEDFEDDDLDDEDNVESDHPVEADVFLSLDDFESLDSLRAVDVDSGERGTFTFSWDSSGLNFEFVEEVVGPISWVKRLGRSFEVSTEDDETWVFEVSKYPKNWTVRLPLDKKVALER